MVILSICTPCRESLLGLELTPDPLFSSVLMNDCKFIGAPCQESLFDLELRLDQLFSPAMINVCALNEALWLERLFTLKLTPDPLFSSDLINDCTINGALCRERLLRQHFFIYLFNSCAEIYARGRLVNTIAFQTGSSTQIASQDSGFRCIVLQAISNCAAHWHNLPRIRIWRSEILD